MCFFFFQLTNSLNSPQEAVPVKVPNGKVKLDERTRVLKNLSQDPDSDLTLLQWLFQTRGRLNFLDNPLWKADLLCLSLAKKPVVYAKNVTWFPQTCMEMRHCAFFSLFRKSKDIYLHF